MTRKVAPPAGAWIETLTSVPIGASISASRPPRARGLKHDIVYLHHQSTLSRPPRARGLKPLTERDVVLDDESRPPRARGLKQSVRVA